MHYILSSNNNKKKHLSETIQFPVCLSTKYHFLCVVLFFINKCLLIFKESASYFGGYYIIVSEFLDGNSPLFVK